MKIQVGEPVLELVSELLSISFIGLRVVFGARVVQTIFVS
jgi:hypothetical protein